MNTSLIALKLPDPTNLILLIIKEELKNRRVFNSLLQIGIDDCWYRADFSELIMGAFGLDPNDDESFVHYDEVMNEQVQRFEPNEASVTAAALVVYEELWGRREISG